MDISSPLISSKASTSSIPLPYNDLEKKAQELEGVFLNTLMSQMFSSLKTEGLFGGGYGEETWRSMQSEQYANLLSQNGGLGLADQIMSNLITIQESEKQLSNSPAMAAEIYNSNTNKGQ